MNGAIGARLSVMMFFQFFVWGAWYVTIGNYMSEIGMGDLTHWPYTVNPIAAIIAPFFLGLVADRYFATEKVLAVANSLAFHNIEDQEKQFPLIRVFGTIG